MNDLTSIRKVMRVTFADGRTIEMDLSKLPDHPIGYIGDPGSHQWFIGKALAIATGGIRDPDKSTPTKLVFIPPSQITGIEIEFIEGKPLLNIVD